MSARLTRVRQTNMNNLLKVMADRYDAGPGTLSAGVIEWAAMHLVEDLGIDKVKAEISQLNKQRERYGLRGCYVPFDHPLF